MKINLDVEYAWRFGNAWTADARMQAFMERWTHIGGLIPAERRPASWGLDPRLGDDVELARKVNSKVFSWGLAERLGVGLNGSCLVHSLDAIRELDHNHAWLIKHPLGVSGRERVSMIGGEPAQAAQWKWLEDALREGPLVAEPKVEIEEEWSVHFEVGSDVECLGSVGLLTDSHGQHRGHRLDIEAPKAAVELSLKVAEELKEVGWKGPVSVDGFHGKIGQTSVFRPLSEINARVTFGRLAVELKRWVPTGNVIWWHPSASRIRQESIVFESLEQISPASGPGFWRLPEEVDPAGRTQTLLVNEGSLGI